MVCLLQLLRGRVAMRESVESKISAFSSSISPLRTNMLIVQIDAYSSIILISQQMNISYAEALGLQPQDLSDFSMVRKAYKSQMTNVLRKRDLRIKLNRAYSEVCAKIFKSSLSSLQLMIINGDLEGLKKEISKDKKLLNAKVNQYPIVYLAVRSGHYDIVEFLLRSGCSIDFKGYKSTPMHCAAYYGHYNIIPLLLMYGMSINIKNSCGSIPIEEAANPEIQRLLTVGQKKKIQTLRGALVKQELSHSYIIDIVDQKEQVIIRKIISKKYKNYYNHKNLDDAFHGTKFENLHSIMRNGLNRPGDVVNGVKINIVPGHIPLQREFQGIKNWSRAVFLSPSIYYSCDPVYSKEFIQCDHVSWLPVVQVKVKKGSYTRHDHTLKYYDPKVAEPTALQFRVECAADKEKNLIIRSEQTQNIIVIALIFIRKGFLEHNQDYEKVTQLILNSPEEQKFRELNS